MNNHNKIEYANPLYPDAWQNIFAQCHSETLIRLESVCKAFYHLSSENSPNSNFVWKEAIIRQFPTIGKVIRLWDDQRFGCLTTNSYKALYKQFDELNVGHFGKAEYRKNCFQRYRYLAKVLKIFESFKTQLNPTEVLLSKDLLRLTSKEKLQWCHQNKGLSFKERQSYAYMFLKNTVERLMDETKRKMNGTRLCKKK